METRRTVPRQPASWKARCCVEPSTAWVDCRILDVSRRGAAIEVPRSIAGSSHIRVDLRSPNDDAFVLCGQIRNQRVGTHRTVIGVEFHEMTRVERVLLNLVMGESSASRVSASA